jgi:GTP cyclohydrolase I
MRELPDITSDINAEMPAKLEWVGMDGIAVPISMQTQDGTQQTFVANANIYVSLDKHDAKGIHMSRLHELINQLSTLECNRRNIEQLLDEMILSQQGISHHARIHMTFDLLLKKPALLSTKSGFQAYPISITAEKTQTGTTFELGLTIPYSSTCPCSASLSRQLFAKAIDQKFDGEKVEKSALLAWIESSEGSVATPHSQRSYAYIELTLSENAWPDLSELIFSLESAIATPVQTAVKRVDEQEFARLNATNLMFCEDAAKRFKNALESLNFVSDYYCKVEHQESLHAHNAVAIVKKKRDCL